MRLLDKLKEFEHTFTSYVAKAYAKLYKAEPKIEAVADTVLKYGIGAVQIIVAAEAGQPAAEAVGAVANEVVKDLHVAGSLLYDFGPNPTVANIVAGAKDQLSGLVTAGHIKNESSVANVNKVVNSLGALVAALPSAPPAAPPPADEPTTQEAAAAIIAP